MESPLPFYHILFLFVFSPLQFSVAHDAAQSAPNAVTESETVSTNSYSNKLMNIPEIWKWCGGEPTAIKNVEVLFENYPLVPGTDFNVIIRGDALEPLDNVTVKSKITAGGLFSIMDVQNLCKGPKRRCPYSAGPQEQRLK